MIVTDEPNGKFYNVRSLGPMAAFDLHKNSSYLLYAPNSSAAINSLMDEVRSRMYRDSVFRKDFFLLF